MTVLGPLTTTFKAPSSCTTTTPQIYQIWSAKEYRYEQGPLFISGSNCFPSAYDPSPKNYYSPGFCPQGYTAACTRTSPIQTQSGTETALICCPTDLSYTCLGSADQATLGCTTRLENAAAVIGVTVISSGVTSGYTTVSEMNAAFAAHSIQVRYRVGDPVPLQAADVITSSTPPSSTSTPTSTSILTQLTSETDAPPPTTTSGVSTAAAVGIGVGSALAALLIVGAIGLFFFLRWRRKRRRPRVPPKDPTRASTYTAHTGAFVPPPFELSEDVSIRHSHAHTLGQDDGVKRELTMARTRARRGTVGTSRTERTMESELEDTGYLHPKAAELEVPVESSVRSVFLGVDRGREVRASTPASESSSSWTIMRKDGVVATPWL